MEKNRKDLDVNNAYLYLRMYEYLARTKKDGKLM